MTHANQTDINNSTSRFNTVIVFRTQRLLDLFKKEMQGQISDGMWENSRNTDWLWRNVACVLGNETRVIVAYRFVIGKKNFMINSALWDCIGERILKELEYSSKKEVYADWREIAEAIRNAREMNDEERKIYVDDCEARGRNREKALKQKTEEVLSELIKRVGVENVQGRIIKEGQVYVTDPEKKTPCICITSQSSSRTNKAWFDVSSYQVGMGTVEIRAAADIEQLEAAINLMREFVTRRHQLAEAI